MKARKTRDGVLAPLPTFRWERAGAIRLTTAPPYGGSGQSGDGNERSSEGGYGSSNDGDSNDNSNCGN